MNMLAKLKVKGKQTSAHEYLHNFRDTYLDEEDLQKPSQQVADELRVKTLENINTSFAKKQPPTTNKMQSKSLRIEDAKYINYTPSNQIPGHNSGASQRVIKMQETQKDPLAPALFKHKKIPVGQKSPPRTIMHSPPRKLTAQDQLDWKIPPCVSNWKNSKGYTIPLEMRLRADGRSLQHITINEKHSKVTNALYIVEREARKELDERNKIQKLISQKEYLQKESEMKSAAQEARDEKNKLLQAQQDPDEDTPAITKSNLMNAQLELEREQREQIRYMQKRELEREERLKNAGRNKAKQVRDQERDISERVALGQAQPTIQREVQFDQRLYNQESGVQAGFGSDDEYKMFDKPLFADRTATNIYSAKDTQEETEVDGGLKNILKRANRTFDGANEQDKSGRGRPVEFEKHSDPAFQMKSSLAEEDVGDKVQKKVKK